MLSRVIRLKNTNFIVEIQDGIAVAPTLDNFKNLKQPYIHVIVRNIQGQGVTAFWSESNSAGQKVHQAVFDPEVSQQIIEAYQLRNLRSPREVKPHERVRHKDLDEDKEGLCINPAYMNLGKVSSIQDPNVKPIKLDPDIPYLWLLNANGEIILGVEKLWEHFGADSTDKWSEPVSPKVEMLKEAITKNFITQYVEEEEKKAQEMSAAKKQLKKSQDAICTHAKLEAQFGLSALRVDVDEPDSPMLEVTKSVEQSEVQKPKKEASEKKETPMDAMLKKKGGLGHASLSPVFDASGKVVSLEGQAYIGGELVCKKGKWKLTNKSGRFYLKYDTIESNTKFLQKAADFLSQRTGQTIEIALEKNKLDPKFLWDKALNAKSDEFGGNKVKIAFNCITKVYKFSSCYSPQDALEIKMRIQEKERLFNQSTPRNKPEDRFIKAIKYFLDTIFPFEKNAEIRAGLTEQIQYMIDHQLSESLAGIKKELTDNLLAKQKEVWEVEVDQGNIKKTSFGGR